jgi:methylated-DNA-[protein]-cysteine S-methyltransferase
VGELVYTGRVASPVGPLSITVSAQDLRRIDFGGPARPAKPPRECARMYTDVTAQLAEYWAGRRRAFDLPLAPEPEGTEFQRAVWQAMLEIPYGEVLSYGDVAAWVGRPGATRAVGTACGANRIALVIPCHRVVARSGLGGFGGGLAAKVRLLALERENRHQR